MRYTNVPWFLLLQPPHPIPMTPMTGLKGTTGRTNVKPQTFKTAANAALSLGWWQMLMGKRCQPMAQLGPTVWGDLYLYSLYVVFAVKLQIDFLQKVDSIHTHLHTIPPSSELYSMCSGCVWLGLISHLTCESWFQSELVKIAVDTKRHVAGSRMLEAVACIGQVRSIQDEQLGEWWFRHRDLGGLVIGSVQCRLDGKMWIWCGDM